MEVNQWEVECPKCKEMTYPHAASEVDWTDGIATVGCDNCGHTFNTKTIYD